MLNQETELFSYSRASRGIFLRAWRTPRSPRTSSAPARTWKKPLVFFLNFLKYLKKLTGIESRCPVILQNEIQVSVKIPTKQERTISKLHWHVHSQWIYPSPLLWELFRQRPGLRLERCRDYRGVNFIQTRHITDLLLFHDLLCWWTYGGQKYRMRHVSEMHEKGTYCLSNPIGPASLSDCSA